MLRPALSLLASAWLFSVAPALAEDAPTSFKAPAESPAARPPPPSGYPYWSPPPYPYWSPPPPAMERRSTAAFVGGILLVSVGIAGLAAGTGVYLAATRHCSFNVGGPGGFEPSSAPPVDCSDHDSQVAGMAVLIGSTLFIGAGIPLWIYGTERVPKLDRDARVRPMLVVGPRSAGIRWSF
jgi:hypothetical protein